MTEIVIELSLSPRTFKDACHSSSACLDRIFSARRTITIFIFGMPPKKAAGTAQADAIV